MAPIDRSDMNSY